MPISTSEVPSNRKFARQLDPNGELDYTVDWSNVLGNNTISSVTLTLSSAASTAGLEVVQSPAIDGSKTTFRLGVIASDHDNTSFDPPSGSELAFKLNMEDSAGQIWEFTFTVMVVQQ